DGDAQRSSTNDQAAHGRPLDVLELPQPSPAVGAAHPGRGVPVRPAGAQPADHHHRAGHRLPDRAVQRRGARAHRDRAQRGHRAGGPAGPGLRRLLRHRRLLGGAALQPRLGAGHPPVLDRDRPDRHGGHDDLRGHPGDPDAAPARRLPGDRDAGLRRDRPAARGQHRAAARQPRLPGHRPSRGHLPRRVADLHADRRARLLLARGRDHHHRADVHGEPRALAGRARLDRRARGRGRRRAHRRADLQVQDLGVRHRRRGRRALGHAVRRAGRLRQQPALRRHHLDPLPRRGGAGRVGQQGRRHRRGVPRLLHPRPLPVRAAVPFPRVRPRADHPDGLPAAGSAGHAPAPADLRAAGLRAVVRRGDGRAADGAVTVDARHRGPARGDAGRPRRHVAARGWGV
ncbi:MAG: Branched-chain amino acid transport system permease protein LivM, partial [uncultured Actinomycetospora sp.]